MCICTYIILTKSILQALPTYVMQIVSLSKSNCEKIDKACRGFLWGGLKLAEEGPCSCLGCYL